MPPIVCIVGRPGAGKTTLIERLIPELKERGYRVATIKHTTHRFETDIEGKDSWKHAQAGSECAVLSSGHKVALLRDVAHDMSPSELARLITDDFDLIIAEGFKRSEEPKVEVYRSDVGDMVCSPDELLAVVSDDEIETDVPHYSFQRVAELASLIESRVVKRGKTQRISVFADGKPVPLKPFLEVLYHRLICDMVLPLRGFAKPKRIDVYIRRRE